LSANEIAVVRAPAGHRCFEDLNSIGMATAIHGVATITIPMPKISSKADTVNDIGRP
jgi:hypothetical protein